MIFGVMSLVGSVLDPLKPMGIVGGLILILIGTFSLDKIKKNK
jgi:hypothetical protein